MLRRATLVVGLVALAVAPACFIEKIAGRYCSSNNDCSEQGYGQCDPRFHTCVPDDVDLGLDFGGDDMAFPPCTTSATCPADAPVCSPVQMCTTCGAAGMSVECATYHTKTPLCGPNGACVECVTKDNCDAVHQTCSAMNTCVPCVSNGDCTSGVCNAGVCADKATLLYVNNAAGAGCSDTGAGSFAVPFCTVQKGLSAAAAAMKPLVVFAGTYTENLQASTALNSGNDSVVTVTGVGMPVVKPSVSGAALNVAGTAGKQVTIALDGFVFDGSMLADGSDGVDCNGGSGNSYGKTLVTITNSQIKGASGIGLSGVSKCTVTLDADILVGNKGGAIKTDTCDLAFTNLLIHDNGTSGAGGSAFGGILFSTAGETGKTTMFNLTVVDNLATPTATASGINCVAAPSTVANTLILGNQGPTTEINAACMPSYSAFIGGATSNNENIPVTGCGVPDLLVDPAHGDYHPKKGGTRPCTLVDQGTNTGAPDHDLDGVSRPQPASGTDDIGCYEAK